MRVVDINPAASRSTTVSETWVFAPEARTNDPALLDTSTLPAGRPVLVAAPGPISALQQRLMHYRERNAPPVIRLFPGAAGHGYPLEDWALSPLPEFAEREELALMVDMGGPSQAFPWSEIVSFARDYPRLPVVAIGAPLGGPVVARALDATPNLILETSALCAEDLGAFVGRVKDHGAFRFVFGGGLDANNLAVALGGADSLMVSAGTADEIANLKWGSAHL